jgi:outer membrane immunogenic protein
MSLPMTYTVEALGPVAPGRPRGGPMKKLLLGRLLLGRLLLGSVAFAAVAAGQASAADLGPTPAPAYTKAPAMAALYDWTGFYVGGHASYGWSHSNGQTTDTADGRLFAPGSNSSSAFHGGGQIGFDYMVPSRVVFGVVATISSGGSNTNTFIGPNVTITSEGKTDVSGNLRGRVGYAFDALLLYGTGGWGWSRGSSTRTQVAGTVGNATPGTVESVSTSSSGWTVGGGLDYAFARNWDVFAEYRHAGPRSITIAFPIAQRSTTSSASTDVIEVGVNWRLNWGGPLGARY